MHPFDERKSGPRELSARSEAELLLGARQSHRPMLLGGGVTYYFASVSGYTDEDNPTSGLSSGGGYLVEDDGGAHRKHLFLKLNHPLTFGQIRALSLGRGVVTCWPSSAGFMQVFPVLDDFDASLTWNTEGALSYYTTISYPCGNIAISAAPAAGGGDWYPGFVYPNGIPHAGDIGSDTIIYGLKLEWITPIAHVLASFTGAGSLLAVPR